MCILDIIDVDRNAMMLFSEYDAFSSLPLSDDEDETESKEETYNIPRSQEEIKMLEKNAEVRHKSKKVLAKMKESSS